MKNQQAAFIYWDNSNIFISTQAIAAQREGEGARSRVRIHFNNMLQLAGAGRETKRAFAVGSIPPELEQVWNNLENQGVDVQLLQRSAHAGEVGVDQALQNAMLRDLSDFNGDPGIVVLLTGDGGGFDLGKGFHADLERMHNKGWRIEVLSWRHSCKKAMSEWAEEKGVFIALDDFYENVTFLEAPNPGEPYAPRRDAIPIDDLSKRATAN